VALTGERGVNFDRDRGSSVSTSFDLGYCRSDLDGSRGVGH